MKWCRECGVKTAGPGERCPLCYATLMQLDSASEAPQWPILREQAEKVNILLRILLFLSIASASICVTINWLTFKEHWWSLIVVANILYMWVSIGTAVRRHVKLGFTIVVQVISLAALLVIIDWFAGNTMWSLNYVVPLLFITAMLSITIIIIVKRMAIQSFILYFFLIALLGFIPIILLALNVVNVLWPSVVSAVYSAISLISIFIFADNATKIELKKRFHI